MPDDRAAACHPLNADREGDGHDRGQPLGNGRYGQVDPGERRVRCRSRSAAARPSMIAAKPIASAIARPTRSSSRVKGVSSGSAPSSSAEIRPSLGHGSGGHGDPLA